MLSFAKIGNIDLMKEAETLIDIELQREAVAYLFLKQQLLEHGAQKVCQS
jgi:hypothetical protein